MEWRTPLFYFTDAVLRGPTIGSILMCLAAALVGVLVFLRKQSLLGESLSHATYPGVILGVVATPLLEGLNGAAYWAAFSILTGAFLAALLGLWIITFLQRVAKLRSDSALCLVLSGFFGIGLTLASRVQFTHTALYKRIQMYLYGQAATMTDKHILIYAVLCCIVIAMVFLLYKELQVMNFDIDYARSLGLRTGLIEAFFFVVTVLAVVIGIRCVGIVLMSAMLIAPAAAARQFTNRLSVMFCLAGLFGLMSGFLGNYLSVEISENLRRAYPTRWLALPSGPMIVLVASTLCLLSLLFAPQRGVCWRLWRAARFRRRCLQENLLKAIWKQSPKQSVSFQELRRFISASRLSMWWGLHRLSHAGWVRIIPEDGFALTEDGQRRAAHIVRLHRLWEVYLADQLGIGAERVHPSAEEMEHVLTPELEKQLAELLHNPSEDPHKQPIPPASPSSEEDQ